MAISHPDKALNAIFEMLQQERDNAILKAAAAINRVATLEAELVTVREQAASLAEQVKAAIAAAPEATAPAPEPLLRVVDDGGPADESRTAPVTA